MHIIHEAVVGSRLRGNHTSESDTDSIGIFIASNEDIGGFNWNDSRNVVSDASPEGDDHTFYEIRKFLRLAAKSTPAILPFMSSDLLISSSPLGREALCVAQGLISEEWLRKNANYVIGKFHSYISTGKIKELIEAYYMGELTSRWLQEGPRPSATFEHHRYYSRMPLKQFMESGKDIQLLALELLATDIKTRQCHPDIAAKANLDNATIFLADVRNNHA